MLQSAGKVCALVAFITVLVSVAMLLAQTDRDRTPKETSAPVIGSQAPDFSLRSLDGSEVSLGAWRGQIVLANFWATWCVPCRAEMPQIQAAYQVYRDKGLTVLAINQGEDKETVERFAQEFHITFPILLDGDGQVAKRYAVRGLPASYFVDREAVIRGIRFGEMSGATIASQLGSLGLPAISELATLIPTIEAATSPERLNMNEFFPPGEGHDLVVETCLTCHEILTFGLARKTKGGWMQSLANHANRFRSLSDAQIEMMYGYLVVNLTPDTPISKQLPLGYACGT